VKSPSRKLALALRRYQAVDVNAVSQEKCIIGPAVRPVLGTGSLYEWRVIRPQQVITSLADFGKRWATKQDLLCATLAENFA
jgi:hypothetical protein